MCVSEENTVRLQATLPYMWRHEFSDWLRG